MAIHVFLSIVALAHFSSISATPPEEVCDTPSCKAYASGLMHDMNTYINPCTSFYGYVCGKWGHTLSSNPEYIRKSWDEVYFKRLLAILEPDSIDGENPFVIKGKELYKGCMDESAIEKNGIGEIMNYIKQTGGWPIIMNRKTWKNSHKAWETVDSEYNVITGTSLFVHFAMEPAANKSDGNHLVVRPSISPGDSSPNVQLKRKHGDHSPRETADEKTKNLIKEIAGVIAREGGFVLDETQVERDAEGIVSFLRRLERMTRSPESKSPEVKTIQEFQASSEPSLPNLLKSTAKRIDWLQRIRQLFVRNTSVRIDSSTKIVVHHARYFKSLFSILSKTSERNIVNTIQWWFINQTLTYTNPEMLGIDDDPRPRWEKCIKDNELQYALAYVEAEKNVKETKVRVVDMVKEVKIAIKKGISDSEWLDEYSKRAAKEKVDSMTALVGYPDWYNHPIKLGNELYKNLLSGSSYLENVLLAKQFKFQQKLELVGKPFDEWSLGTSIIDVNAYYHHDVNTIALPAGILQEPLFNADYPHAINYGGIGARIGYLISQAFDSKGILYDKEGFKINLWSNATINQEYQKRRECFIKYLNKHISLAHWTFDELIADNTVVRAAFVAYKAHIRRSHERNKMLPGFQNFTSDQLFFVSFAWAHCRNSYSPFGSFPNKGIFKSPAYRIHNAMWNTKDFVEAFNCMTNYRSNRPEERCTIW